MKYDRDEIGRNPSKFQRLQEHQQSLSVSYHDQGFRYNQDHFNSSHWRRSDLTKTMTHKHDSTN